MGAEKEVGSRWWRKEPYGLIYDHLQPKQQKGDVLIGRSDLLGGWGKETEGEASYGSFEQVS